MIHQVSLTDPAGIQKMLTEAIWGCAFLMGEPYLLVCPICQCPVLAVETLYEDGTTMKETHIRYHVDLATAIRDARHVQLY